MRFAFLIVAAAAAHAQLTQVHEQRVLDDMSRPGDWKLQGAGEMTFGRDAARNRLRVNVALQGRNGLPSANAVRTVAGEDWRGYNRLAFWLRTDVSGFPVLTLIVTLRNQSKETISPVHVREAEHNVTVPNGKWTYVEWDIPHLLREHVTALEFHPWVNKRLPEASDRAAYEIGPIELLGVEGEHY
jgi:hypothetical protein